MPKDTKEVKSKSSSKDKDTEVKETKVKHNQATDKAGLSFNVNTTKNWIKKQMEVQDLEMPKFHGAHVGLTAIIESLLMSILNHVNSQLPKDKSSLYKITLPVLSYNLQLDDNFGKLFRESFSTYDADTNYAEHFWMSKSDVTSFIESHWSDNIQLDVKAYNQLAYLLMRYAIVITKTAYHMMSYAGKKTLEPKALRTAVLIHTPETIANSILIKLDDAVKNTESEDGEEDDSEEKEEKKSSKDSKESKDSKKKSTAKEVSESDDESDDDSDSDKDEESEAESEPEEKPVAKGKKGDKTVKASPKEEKKIKASKK
jgi:hypothetical protein